MTTMSSTMTGFDDAPDGSRFMMGLLGGIAALMLVTATLEMQEYKGGAFLGGQLPMLDNVREMRPQGPPPVIDVDQLTPEEVEQPVTATPYTGAVGDIHRDARSSRSRPQM